MSRKTILFVDDEKRVLDGLRRMLRPLRKALDMHFVESGREALEIMEEIHFDIIVSDMRMPQMDGAELLAEVKKRYPETMRIVLTGQASTDITLRTVGIAHQFLDKPCEPERLKAVIQRALFIKRLMSHPSLEKLIAGIGTLPSLPSVYAEIQKKLADPESSVDDVARCIEKDVAMSAKILQLVNSAFFGHFQNVKSPAKAVHLLGIETIKALVLSLHIFEQFKGGNSLPISLENLWEHSLFVGNLAQKIAKVETEKQDEIDYSFMAGLLHDIGKLILAANMPDRYQEAVDLARNSELELYQAETKVFRAGHAEIGGYLMGLWGLPGPIIEAIVYHHHPERYPSTEFDVLTAVYVADCLAHEVAPEAEVGALPTLDNSYLKKIGCLEKIDSWRNLCLEERNRQNE